MLQFKHVKLAAPDQAEAAFDELQLAVYTPEGVHLFRHDLRAGVSTNGKATAATGRQITFYGPSRQEASWRVVLASILDKLAARTTPLASAGFDEPRLAAAVAAAPLPFTASAYEGVLLAECSGKARANVLGAVVRRLDAGWVHPGAVLQNAVAGEDVNGFLVLAAEASKQRTMKKRKELHWTVYPQEQATEAAKH